MNRTIRCIIASCLPFACLLSLVPAARADQWTAPTPEELSMTSQPEVPGAAAVYLNREEITDDKLFNHTVYFRLKVLNEKGRDYGDVQLNQFHFVEGMGFITEIQARTIHSDGSIIPFTGKPMEKLVHRGNGFSLMQQVVSMPSVEVGSILEFRCTQTFTKLRSFGAPEWYLQQDLFTRKAHFVWRPAQGDLYTGPNASQHINEIAWTSALPKDVQLKQQLQGGGVVEELTVSNMPPLPDEELMPPIRSFGYRVLFFYTSYKTTDEYWEKEGKVWAQARDKFIGPGTKVKEAVQSLVSPTDTDEQKLRKFYAAVMKLDNTSFSRSHTEAEDKSEGLHPTKSTEEVWENKRGNDDQITDLFVGMARAAGLKAYVMAIPNRDSRFFMKDDLTFAQFEDYVAIVTVNGQEQFFDPGQRFCPYGHLAWKHAMAQGIRQTEQGAQLATTPTEPYTSSSTQRIADLKLDEQGNLSGTVKMTWSGSPALTWRQKYITNDRVGLERDLQTDMDDHLPIGLQTKVSKIDNLEDYEQPLVVSYEVEGPVTFGKRLILPADVFEARTKATFPHQDRQTAVYFEYPCAVRDAVRINFPAAFKVEYLPPAEKLPYEKSAVYSLTTDSSPSSITTRREFIIGKVLFPVAEYSSLRNFYGKFEVKDQESIILDIAAAASAGN